MFFILKNKSQALTENNGKTFVKKRKDSPTDDDVSYFFSFLDYILNLKNKNGRGKYFFVNQALFNY